MTDPTEPAANPWKDYQIDVVLKNIQFPEGAFWSKRDNCLYFVEWTGDKIWAFRERRGEVVATVSSGDGPCGLCQDKSGYLWATLYSSGKVIKLDSSGRIVQTIADCNGTTFKGPNQITVDPQGWIVLYYLR